MPPPPSLAELTLNWCAGEVTPGKGVKISQRQREAMAAASREAAKAAGVGLLQAGAGELSVGDSATLGLIAAVIEDEAAMAGLEERLSHHAHPGGSPAARAAIVGHLFKEWMMEQAGDELPPRMQGWLERGWPDLRARGGVMTFYQAFCGALQRAVRRDQATWDELMNNTGVEAAAWRQWLIREAETGGRPGARSPGKVVAKVFAVLAIIAALSGAGAWYWWKEIGARLRSLDQPGVEYARQVAPAVSPRESVSPASSTTPEPAPSREPSKTVAESPVKPSPAPVPTPAPTRAEMDTPVATAASPRTTAVPSATPSPAPPVDAPRVNIRPDPFAEAARLMASAESTLGSENHEAGDRSARSAQDILSVRTPLKDAQLAEHLIRVGQYWERREDWAEAARLYQRAVKAYEKTPAENANPQLQAVSRWASALRHAGRNTEAERLYRMLLQAYEGMGVELRPDMATVAHNLGNVLFATGRLRDSRESYGLALKLVADRQEDPSVQPLIERFKQSYIESLRKLGVSEVQIEADLRQTLGTKTGPKPPASR